MAVTRIAGKGQIDRRILNFFARGNQGTLHRNGIHRVLRILGKNAQFHGLRLTWLNHQRRFFRPGHDKVHGEIGMIVIAAEVVLLHDGTVIGHLHIERLVIVPRNMLPFRHAQRQLCAFRRLRIPVKNDDRRLGLRFYLQFGLHCGRKGLCREHAQAHSCRQQCADDSCTNSRMHHVCPTPFGENSSVGCKTAPSMILLPDFYAVVRIAVPSDAGSRAKNRAALHSAPAPVAEHPTASQHVTQKI